MVDRSNLVIRGRSEHTKRRQQIDILLKKAMNRNGKAKLKLYKDFGIRIYSSAEVKDYVQERMSQEYASSGRGRGNGPAVVTRKRESRGLSRSSARQSRSRKSTTRAKSREKAKPLLKKT